MIIPKIRHDWTEDEIAEIYTLPLPELIFRAQVCHHAFHAPDEVQGASLLNIKSGGCPDDCSYCPQSAHHDKGLNRTPLMSLGDVTAAAEKARMMGATRFCMGAAWRDVPGGSDFERVLILVRSVAALGLEVCCTMGMLDDSQAEALAAAGLTSYNHNLDTSPEFYGKIITTRTYEDRIRTLQRVRSAGISICCGGIIGMGESRRDRYLLLQQLASLQPHPESVPINLLVRIEGTPLANQGEIDVFDLVRMIACARILMPESIVRLSAGRLSLCDEAQALCFVAGANSIFLGEKLLTTLNPEVHNDQLLLDRLGMRLRSASGDKLQSETSHRD